MPAWNLPVTAPKVHLMNAIAHLLRKSTSSLPVCRFWCRSIMTRSSRIDTSPPVNREMRDKVDKSFFHKTVQVLAAKVPPTKAGVILKAEAMRG